MEKCDSSPRRNPQPCSHNLPWMDQVRTAYAVGSPSRPTDSCVLATTRIAELRTPRCGAASCSARVWAARNARVPPVAGAAVTQLTSIDGAASPVSSSRHRSRVGLFGPSAPEAARADGVWCLSSSYLHIQRGQRLLRARIDSVQVLIGRLVGDQGEKGQPAPCELWAERP